MTEGPRTSADGSEITVFTKASGPLTKRISLTKNGEVVSDGSACKMARGGAQRAPVADLGEFAAIIEQLRSNQAIALGALRAGLPKQVKVTLKAKLNGAVARNVIARTGDHIVYRKAERALALCDYDTKGMPAEVAAEVKRLGGFWAALTRVVPELANTGYVMRGSTSAGLFRRDTGARLKGSDGQHAYVEVQDGTDIERFLRVVDARCWLLSYGWMIVGAAGQLLERSIVDRMVGRPERLVFEGKPILKSPLRQERRRPIVVAGDVLDTLAACPPLTIAEKARLEELKAKAAYQLAVERAKLRSEFIERQAKRLAKRTRISEQAAARIITSQCDGVLLPDVELPFDDDEFSGCTVGDVLNNPERFEGATLADPLEGVDYGRCVAKIMRRPDGSLWIHSFAHGRTVYELKYDARFINAALQRTGDDAVVKTFIALAVQAELGAHECEELRNLVAERSGITKRTLSAMLKEAQQQQNQKRAAEWRDRRLAERRDPRPQIGVPSTDAPWLPQMDVLNEIIGTVPAAIPPTRDIDGYATRARQLAVPDMHAFQPASTEDGEKE